MDYSRIMIKEILKVSEKTPARVDLHIAVKYLKWLRYDSDFLNNRIKELTDKGIKKLSSDEIQELKDFKKEREMLPVFERYVSSDCRKEDVLPAYDFMHDVSLDLLMDKRLSDDEKNEARELLGKLSTLPLKSLFVLVSETSNENYLGLNMIDSYVAEHLMRIALQKEEAEINFNYRMKNESRTTPLRHL